MFRLTLIACISISLYGCGEYLSGEKVGEIISCAKQGIFIKTFECSLIRGGIQDGSGAFGEKFNFTIENRDMMEKAKRYMLSGSKVKIKFHQEYVTLFRSDSQDFFVDEIEEVVF